MSWRLASRELRLEWRTREALLPLTLLSVLVVTVGLLSFHDHAGAPETSAAILWSALALAASVGSGRAFVAEADRGTLDPLLALPVERSSIYLAKATNATLVTLLVGAAAVALQMVLGASVPAGAWLPLVAVVLLGALGLAATTTMVGALAAQARTRELLLPILALPLLLPLLISAVHGTHNALTGEPLAAELMVLAGYDIAFLGVSALLADEVLGA